MNAPAVSPILKTLLFVISALEAVAGVLLLFATDWIVGMLPAGTPIPRDALTVTLIKGIGLIAILFGYFFCAAAREPARYIAIIDGTIALCFAAAALNVYAVTAIHLDAYYPRTYLLTRAIVQIVFGVVLIALRPKGARKAAA